MYKARHYLVSVIFISLVLLPGINITHAQEKQSAQPVSCLHLDRIQNVDILDDSHIIFQVGLKDHYLNTLPYACHGLKLNDTIMYRTSLNEICNVDVITVLNKIGTGYQAGPSCGLGKFEPVTTEQIKTLRESIRKK